MADTPALVQRWAGAWREDPIELLSLYAGGARTWSLGPAGCHELDRDAFLAAERRGLTRVPDRGALARTVVQGGDLVVVEWLLTGRSAEDLVPMVAPAATWWRLDRAGRIEEEVRVADWSARVILDDEQRRPLPAVAGEPRSQGWYRDFVERLLEVAAFDPALARSSAYTQDAEDRALVAAPVPTAGSPPPAVPAAADVTCVGSGGTIAARIGAVPPAGLVLVTLDGSDRVVSERRYGAGWWPGAAWAAGAGPG